MSRIAASQPGASDSQNAFARGWDQIALLFLVVTTLARMALLPSLDLSPDEAYYWDWSRRPALGYYDQGPFIAYLIRATTAVFGGGEFGVRMSALLASLVTIAACWLLARRLFSPLAGLLTVVTLGVTPLMLVGSAIATYDPPLVAFWALAVVCLERALFADNLKTQTRAWLLAGVMTGLGFLSKHTMLLILPCLLLFLVLSPGHRVWLRRPLPYAAFGLTLLLYSGVIWWNAGNHWWTFGHLLFLTAKNSSTFLRRLGDFVGSQALLIGPGLFLGTLWIAGRSLLPRSTRKSDVKPSPQVLFLVCLGVPVFLFFCLLTAKSKVQGNWSPCAWLTPTVLLCGIMAARWNNLAERRRVRVGFGLTVALSVFLCAGLLSSTLRAALGIHLPPETDNSNLTYGWRQTARRVQQSREALLHEGKPVFIIGNGYQFCAEMGFYLPDRPETFDMFLRDRLTMYAAYVERQKTHLGENALFVNDTRAEDADLRQLFARVEWEPPLPIYRPGASVPIRTVYIARCYGFRRYVGLEWAKGG